jgi:hypothetical protein
MLCKRFWDKMAIKKLFELENQKGCWEIYWKMPIIIKDRKIPYSQYIVLSPNLKYVLYLYTYFKITFTTFSIGLEWLKKFWITFVEQKNWNGLSCEKSKSYVGNHLEKNNLGVFGKKIQICLIILLAVFSLQGSLIPLFSK